MEFLVATHNKKKKKELTRILAPIGIQIVTADDISVTLREVEETGETFEENALLKARAGCEDSGLPCIADDSGLCIDALNGEPGIFSARYLGEDTPYSEKIKIILERLKDVPAERRTARFISTVACYFPNGTHFTVRGVCEGVIGTAVKGENGFGYDPVFYVNGVSFAELSDEEKDKISHRGKALRLLSEELKKYIPTSEGNN